MKKIYSSEFNRYVVYEKGEDYIFYDFSLGSKKTIPVNEFKFLDHSDPTISYFANGFLSGRYSANIFSLEDVGWQRPVITEFDSFNKSLNQSCIFDGHQFNIYLGLPWASYIDGNYLPDLSRVGKYFYELKKILKCLDSALSVSTVCQHVKWSENIELFLNAGVTTLFVSHFSSYSNNLYDLSIYPWHLYPVNYLDPERNEGLVDRPFMQREYLISFIGAYGPGYLNRKRIETLLLSKFPDCFVKLRDEWHFETVVYPDRGIGQVDDLQNRINLVEYNNVLSNSKFSLVPSGVGANTIRLWESLAVGAVPVILDKLLDVTAYSAAGYQLNDCIVDASHMTMDELYFYLKNIDEDVWREMSFNSKKLIQKLYSIKRIM